MEWWVALPPHVRPAANRGFGWLGGCPLADPGLDPRGSGTILVVEDEPSVRAMLVRVLADAGYTPVVAEHGAAALDVLRTANEPSRVRLVISDQAMPIMDGATLAERIAAE
jgi:response regulator RpfG family c-di-GMP phosphodiesterase